MMLPLQRHAEQRVAEEVTLYLLKRYSEWYQNAVTTICSRTARLFRHTKRMSALGKKETYAGQKACRFTPERDAECVHLNVLGIFADASITKS